MTTHEKVGNMFMSAGMAFGNDQLPKGGVDEPSTAIPRLGVAEFNYMAQGNVYRGASNGCLVNCCSYCPGSRYGPPPHACCHDGGATQFPQGTGVAATWNASCVFEMGRIASEESRGMMHFPTWPNGTLKRMVDYRSGASSVINILKDGRWGRAPETYGECPVLTGDIAVAFNKGLMGYVRLGDATREHGDRIKVLGGLRHFVAYAGPDSQRFHFNAVVSDDDLRMTYLPAWKALVDADALGGVMSAISGLNGVPSVVDKTLLTGKLRGEWGFDGFVLSDCDTVGAVEENFHWTAGLQQSVAASVKAGNDLNCGPQFADLVNATLSGFIDERDLDVSVTRLLRRRIQVGDLDLPVSADPYASVPYSVVDSAEHKAFARQIVAEGTVLLHNSGALPLAKGKTYLVIGPSADDPSVQAHTYHGTPSVWTTVLAGLKEVGGAGTSFRYICGLDPCERESSSAKVNATVLAAAKASDVDGVIFVGGLQANMEEEGTDRVGSIALPGKQLELIQAVHAVGKPLVAVTINGGPVAEPFLANAPKLAWVWSSYFGQDGRGIADVLFGDVPFSGALPFTVPQLASDFGNIADYSMNAAPHGKTYRYWRYSNASSIPMFPFAFGLGLAELSFESLRLSSAQKMHCPPGHVCVTPKNDTVAATVVIKNASPKTDGATVVALFGSFLAPNSSASGVKGTPASPTPLPARQLLNHTKVAVRAGGSTTVALTISVLALAGAPRQAWPGTLAIWVGHGLGNPCSLAASAVTHVGAKGEGAPPAYANLSLVLPMVQVPSSCDNDPKHPC